MTGMRPALLLAAIGLTAPVVAQPSGGAVEGKNAALKYWQGFALMPSRDEADRTLLKNWKTVPLDATARSIVTNSDKVLLNLQRGARLPNCSWALDYGDGPSMLLPHIDRSRLISQIACLRARLAVTEGRTADAADDALAVMTLGRHVQTDPIMIAVLVGLMDEQFGIDALALMLPKLDAATLKHVSDRLDGMPAGATIEQIMPIEKEYMTGWYIRWFKTHDKPEEVRAMVRATLDGAEGVEDILKLVEDGSPKRLLQTLEEMLSCHDELQKIIPLPRDQFYAQWAVFEKKWHANPTVRVFLHSIPKCIDARDREKARFAMLKAAVAVVQDGQAALAKHRDPFGAGPFQHKPVVGGFELRSNLVLDKEPVTLTVGMP